MNHSAVSKLVTPSRPTGLRLRPRLAATSCALAACLVAGGCTDWFGDENTSPAQFEVVVSNQSDREIYYAFGESDATEPTGRFETVLPGEEFSLGFGVAVVGDEPGGCFTQPFWVLTSRSGRTYRQGEISEYADDLGIIRHFSAGDCTDQEQITVEYDGPDRDVDGTDPGSEGTALKGTEEQPLAADDPSEQGRRRRAVELDLGGWIDIDGVALSVSGIDHVADGGSGAGDEIVYLEVSVENRSESPRSLPGLEVRCVSNPESAAQDGRYPGSTYVPHDDLPAGERVDATYGAGVPAGCVTPVVWAEGNTAAFWPLGPLTIYEPAQESTEQLAFDMIEALEVSDEVKVCMRDAVADFALSEQDVRAFGDLDGVASRADQGDERAIQIMNEFQAALAYCN